ncbi:MAG: hypothetical protein MRY49_02795 [Candidatus Pacebacteria bacterium]|nr:hypothetical protein [Candidatus Paceibacterota bacterium]
MPDTKVQMDVIFEDIETSEAVEGEHKKDLLEAFSHIALINYFAVLTPKEDTDLLMLLASAVNYAKKSSRYISFYFNSVKFKVSKLSNYQNLYLAYRLAEHDTDIFNKDDSIGPTLEHVWEQARQTIAAK